MEMLVECCFRSTETVGLLGTGAQDGHLDFHTAAEVRRWGKREIRYLSLRCQQQNESCIKMGSDESHFNVSLIVMDKVTRQCPQTTTFLKRKESRSGIEPRSFRLPAFLPPYR